MNNKSLTVFWLAALFSVFFMPGSNSQAQVVPDPGITVRKIMLEIGQSRSACEDFDYFPEGGIRNFACHIRSFISYTDFQRIAGVKIFLSGPHTEKDLDLGNPGDFGRYNPEFVRRIREILIPAASDEDFRRASQGSYDTYVAPLARIYYVTYSKMRDNPRFLEKEKANYLNCIRKVEPYNFESFFYFMNPKFLGTHDPDSLMEDGFDGGYNGNVVKSAVAFWLRRSIDGTDREFFRGLEKLLAVYDQPFLRRVEKSGRSTR